MSSRTCASDTRRDHSRTRECTASAVTPVAAMAAICAYVTSSPKKGRPAKSSKRTRPADQMSSGGRRRTVACSEIESATASSGATYRREWQGVSDEPSSTAPPKSTSLSSPAPPNLMKWCGLMSQCTRPTWCTRASSCSTRCARAVSIRVDSPPPPPPPSAVAASSSATQSCGDCQRTKSAKVDGGLAALKACMSDLMRPASAAAKPATCPSPPGPSSGCRAGSGAASCGKSSCVIGSHSG
mmetsp:Transcript_37104/g.124299  ORF Transcript_37104/g.124299 Transcript_37104/m.124299 type:complete len:241 (-) Transcript_37104:677-1399(-)